MRKVSDIVCWVIFIVIIIISITSLIVYSIILSSKVEMNKNLQIVFCNITSADYDNNIFKINYQAIICNTTTNVKEVITDNKYDLINKYIIGSTYLCYYYNCNLYYDKQSQLLESIIIIITSLLLFGIILSYFITSWIFGFVWILHPSKPPINNREAANDIPIVKNRLDLDDML